MGEHEKNWREKTWMGEVGGKKRKGKNDATILIKNILKKKITAKNNIKKYFPIFKNSFMSCAQVINAVCIDFLVYAMW